MKQNKGISLIVLIITIIIIIILAGAVILTLVNSNIIGEANKAVFLSDMTNYRSQLSLKIMDEMLSTGAINAEDIWVEEGEKVGDSHLILDYIPDMKKEYLDYFAIQYSTLMISQKAPAEWKEWFGNNEMIGAILPNVTSISNVFVNNSSTFIKTDEGKVFAMGLNANGQLGIGNIINQETPVEVIKLSNVKEIISSAKSSRFVYAIMQDDSVYAWGINSSGQLGNGTLAQVTTPTMNPNLNGLIGFSVGNEHTLAITHSGTVKTWGYNNKGQLGLGHTTAKNTPTDILELNNIKQVAAGSYFSLALTKDGKVYTWGANESGQLGLGDKVDRNLPTEVPGLQNVKEIAAGQHYVLALTNDGKIYTWGDNDSGTLGLGLMTDQMSPVLVESLNNVKEIYVSNLSNFVVLEDNSIYTFGSNSNGQLGQGNFLSNTLPVKSSLNYNNIKKIALGLDYTILLTNDGTLKSVGNNKYSQLGIPLKNNNQTEFKKINIEPVDTIYSERYQVVVKLKNNQYKCWGGNKNGALGIKDIPFITKPKDFPIQTNIEKIIIGGEQNFVQLNDGTVKGFGANWHGTIGLGHNKFHVYVPVDVPALKDIKDITIGTNNSAYAIMEDGTAKGWGKGESWLLGLGDTNDRHLLTTIPNLTNIKEIHAGHDFAIALLKDDSTMVWGKNNSGIFGIGNKISSSVPIKGADLKGVKKIDTSINHILALMEDGTVKAWGSNYKNQLGLGDTVDRTIPTEIPGLINVKEIFAGGEYSMAILNDGTVKVWGSNENGQLGLGHRKRVSSPTTLDNFSNVKQVSGNFNTSFLLLEDGKMYASGNNNEGNLANGQMGDMYHTFLTIECKK